MKNNEEYLDILRKIYNKPDISQRKLAQELNFSLGKLNYCIKALRKKGLVKIKNFEQNPKKFKYIYILTPKGIKKRTMLTINFIKVKMREYEKLKIELKKMRKNV